MLPSFVCFLCCLVVAAFIARAGAVAVLRARQKGAMRPSFFPVGWTVVSGLALAIAAVQIGVAVHEMICFDDDGRVCRSCRSLAY